MFDINNHGALLECLVGVELWVALFFCGSGSGPVAYIPDDDPGGLDIIVFSILQGSVFPTC